MSGDPPADRVLDRVAQRREVLEAVEVEGGDVRDLRDALDVSRSTVYEATRELEAVGLLARGDDGFELTPFGRTAVEVHDRCRDALETLCEIRPELARLQRDVQLNPAMCHEADVVRAEPHAPDRPFEAMVDFFDGASRMRGFVPVTGIRYIEGVNEALAEDDSFALEAVTEARVVEYLLSNHARAVDRWLSSDRVRLYETDARLPFGLLVEEDPAPSVGVMLYDEGGQLRVLLRAESRVAVAWGREQFLTHREEATELGTVGD
ncbi:MAG: helix-turn-helix transcriptional regulator [Haloferacaceae archaeon]